MYFPLFLICLLAMLPLATSAPTDAVAVSRQDRSELLSLPPELLLNVLEALPPDTIGSMRRVNKYVHDTIENNAALPYWTRFFNTTWSNISGAEQLRLMVEKSALVKKVTQKDLVVQVDESVTGEMLSYYDERLYELGIYYELRGAVSAVPIGELKMVRTIALEKYLVPSPSTFLFPPRVKNVFLADLDHATVAQLIFPESVTKLGIHSVPLKTLHDIHLPPKLEELSVSGLMTSLEGVTWPSTLIKLNIGFSSIATLAGIALPKALKVLSIASAKLTTMLDVVFPPTLEELDISDNDIISIHDVDFPATLKHLDISEIGMSSLHSVRLPCGLLVLLMNSNKLTTLDDVEWPTGLTELNVADNHITSFDRVAFPVSLLDLDMSENPVHPVRHRSFLPPRLQALYMIDMGLSSLASIELPETLLHLEVSSNLFTDLDRVMFPPRLKTLHLEDCGLKTLRGISFPDSLLELHVDRNDIVTLAGVSLPPNLTMLDVSNSALVDFEGVIWPSTLKRLWLTGTFPADGAAASIAFPDGVEDLNFSGTSVEQIVFPKTLKRLFLSHAATTGKPFLPQFPDDLEILDLSNNELEHLDGIYLPPRLTLLDLSGNRLSCVPDLRHLSRLKELQLSKNQIRTFDVDCLPRTLRHLDLYDNQLVSIDLLLPLPNLVSLNLGANQLTRLDGALLFNGKLRSLSMRRNPNFTLLPNELVSYMQWVNLEGTRTTSRDGLLPYTSVALASAAAMAPRTAPAPIEQEEEEDQEEEAADVQWEDFLIDLE